MSLKGIIHRGSMRLLTALTLCIIFFFLLINTVQSESGNIQEKIMKLTVANIREDSTHATVVFLESARFFKLMRKGKCYDKYLSILKGAEKKQSTVKVYFLSKESNIITKVAH